MTAIVKQLSAADRDRLRAHFLALPFEDRRLRFGTGLSDAAVVDYANGINFEADAAFGVFGDDLELVGVAHLAFADGSAELGLSVLPGFRRRGIGSALFGRARTHARNRRVGTLFTHCLTENAVIMHIARKCGMIVITGQGESNAFLELAPGDPASLASELMAERIALVDYALKAQFLAARKMVGM